MPMNTMLDGLLPVSDIDGDRVGFALSEILPRSRVPQRPPTPDRIRLHPRGALPHDPGQHLLTRQGSLPFLSGSRSPVVTRTHQGFTPPPPTGHRPPRSP